MTPERQGHTYDDEIEALSLTPSMCKLRRCLDDESQTSVYTDTYRSEYV
jgi:hypothetical protein